MTNGSKFVWKQSEVVSMAQIFRKSKWKQANLGDQCSELPLPEYKIILVPRIPYKAMQYRATPICHNYPIP